MSKTKQSQDQIPIVDWVEEYTYALDGSLLGVQRAQGASESTREYVWLNGAPLFVLVDPDGDAGTGAAATRYVLGTTDLGAPVRAMDTTTGAVVWAADYEVFGKARIYSPGSTSAPVVSVDLRFPGQFYDAETGLHYNWHRYYDPDTGRYITPDPLGLGGGDPTLFAYAGGNPMSFTDPMGLVSGAGDAIEENLHNTLGAGATNIPMSVREKVAQGLLFAAIAKACPPCALILGLGASLPNDEDADLLGAGLTVLGAKTCRVGRVAPKDQVNRLRLDELHSPKTNIPRDARFDRAMQGVLDDATPPIEVEPLRGGGFRIQDGVRRSVAAREIGVSRIPAVIRRPTPGGPPTVPLGNVFLAD